MADNVITILQDCTMHKFTPKDDITLGEIVSLLVLIGINVYGEAYESLPDSMKRHFA